MTPTSFRSKTEEMHDELGVDGRFRNCYHTFDTNEFSADDVYHSFPAGARGNMYAANLEVHDIVATLGIRTAPNIDMNAMADEAMAFMLPRVNEGLSLVNSLLELKDLKRMNPTSSIRRVFSSNRTLGQIFENRASRRKFTKELAGRLTGAHLNAEFGIVPFVRDIVTIADELAGLKYRIGILKQYAGKRQERHYKRVLPDSSGNPTTRQWSWTPPSRARPFNGVGMQYPPVGNYRTVQWDAHEDIRTDWTPGFGTWRSVYEHCYTARWVRRPVYHATMRYSYTLPRMGEAEENIKTHLDALGVRVDPSIIWNAIPFTFLVDWVVDVSSFLQSFARDNFPIETKVMDFCHSLAYHGEYEVWTEFTSKNLSAVANWFAYTGMYWWRTYRGTRSYYSRVRHAPNIHAATTRGYNLRKAAISGSLLVNKLSGGTSVRLR
jgi:hypothetical protein